MERENESNNGTPRFWPARIFDVEITLPKNGASLGDSPHRLTAALQVQSLTITELPNPIEFFAPGISRNPAFLSSAAGGLINSNRQPDVSALPPPSPSPQQNAPRTDADDLQLQVEIGLQEAIGGNVDQGMVDAVVQLIMDTLEELEGNNVEHDEMLNVHLSIEIEEIMDHDSFDQQDDPGLSEEVIMSFLGISTFDTSSEDEDSCCICLDEFSTGDELGEISCDHKFHFKCILEWLKCNNTCPVCRAIALYVN